MKLIGSSDEERYRKELRQGCKYLLEEDGDPGLLALLHREFGAIESVFFLSGYKLSGYHACSLLVNGAIVCHLEMNDEKIEGFDCSSIDEYKKDLKKQGQIKLQIAIELAAAK